MSDTRDRNIEFNIESSIQYTKEYFDQMSQVQSDMDLKDLPEIIQIIQDTIDSGSIVYSMGNGGSCAIADHLVCDFTKGCFTENSRLKSFSLNSNTSLLTAIANDISYKEGFSKQLEYYVEPGDVILLISSSGNSDNIISAIEYANNNNIKSIAFTGFDGGKAKEIASMNIHVPVDNYGIIEDMHQSMMHVIAQFVYLKNR
jgi:D-sedoheptulose 7-phosphate isomerase